MLLATISKLLKRTMLPMFNDNNQLCGPWLGKTSKPGPKYMSPLKILVMDPWLENCQLRVDNSRTLVQELKILHVVCGGPGDPRTICTDVRPQMLLSLIRFFSCKAFVLRRISQVTTHLVDGIMRCLVFLVSRVWLACTPCTSCCDRLMSSHYVSSPFSLQLPALCGPAQ